MTCARNWILLLAMVPVFAWSSIEPFDRATWWLEIFPVLIGFGVLFSIRTTICFTWLTLFWTGVLMIILMIGGHFTYARVPLFDWIGTVAGFERNHFDRMAHFFQGFVPAFIAREVLIRLVDVQRGPWLSVVVICVCLAISAAYELLEWMVALVLDAGATDFLGSQGDRWDTQADMFMALLGASAMVLFFSRWQDRVLKTDAVSQRKAA